MRRLGSITDSVDLNLGKLWEMVRSMGAAHAAVPGPKIQTRLSN